MALALPELGVASEGIVVATTPASLSDLLGIQVDSGTATVEGTAAATIDVAVDSSALVAIVVVVAAAKSAVPSEDTPSVIATNGITSATKKVQLKGTLLKGSYVKPF